MDCKLIPCCKGKAPPKRNWPGMTDPPPFPTPAPTRPARGRNIVQGSYRVLLKSTCAFLCFLFTLVAFFFLQFSEKCFFVLFLAKMCFFSVEPPIFSRKYHYFEGFGHKETKFFFQNLLFYAHFFENIFQPCFTQHKVHSLYLLISIYTFG